MAGVSQLVLKGLFENIFFGIMVESLLDLCGQSLNSS